MTFDSYPENLAHLVNPARIYRIYRIRDLQYWKTLHLANLAHLVNPA